MPRIVVALLATFLVVPIVVFLAAVFAAILLFAGWIGGIAILFFALRQWRKDRQFHFAVSWLRRKRSSDENILKKRKKLEREYEARLKKKEQTTSRP
jgi:hypothetical protein